MLYRLFAVILLCFCCAHAFAQTDDSLFVVTKGDHWSIDHTVQPGETLFSLARRFHVPPAILADENDLTYKSSLTIGTPLSIPVSGYNIQKYKSPQMSDARALYHRVTAEENLFNLSHNSQVAQRTMQQWNNLPDNNLHEGQVLFVGWVLYDATQVTVPADNTAVTGTQQQVNNIAVVTEAPPVTVTEDTPVTQPQVAHTPSSLEALYNKQTAGGTNANTEKGPAAFFDNGMHSNVFYAFHNGTPRGTIIKVYNPGEGKTIFVKVLGPLPATKLYNNCIIGISSAAREALGATEEKAWCELTFANQ